MIIGVGTDMVEIGRIEKACERQSFLNRVYTEEECRQAGGSATRLAGSFAVKEAVSKVFGTGFREFWPDEIEVLRDRLGKPYVVLHGKAGRKAKELGITRIHVSITDTAEFATAFAVGEGEDRL